MKAYVGITDWDWFQLLKQQHHLDEVNFWQPGGSHQFRALQPGELFLFKLHSPRNFIVGGGMFAHSTRLPVSLAWETFGVGNGATSLSEMRTRIEHYRRRPSDALDDYTIGCIVLTQPFFLSEETWLACPSDWKSNIVQGRTYNLAEEPGASLYSAVRSVMGSQRPEMASEPLPATIDRYGQPVLVRPRLGQGAFRLVVTDAYTRRCAVTSEKVLPVLQAAHIRPYGSGGEHLVENGLLLRSDLHTLFDRGYITVTPNFVLEVSHRIRDEFENGRDYYALHGREIHLPPHAMNRPGVENLAWHNEHRFRG
jgi:putative restriction endonuclease